MRHLVLILVSLVSSCLSNITAHPHQRLYNPLVCYVETEGVLFGNEYHVERRHEPCGPEAKYCQKITAHFIDANGEVTQITMKGCDTVSLGTSFLGLPCRGNGCSERVEDNEIFNVCCCNSETCNTGQRFTSICSFLITFLFLLIAFW